MTTNPARGATTGLLVRLRTSGGALMVGASTFFALMALAAKQVSDTIPVAEVVLYRSAIVTLFALAAGWRRGRALLGTNRRVLVARGVLGMTSMFLYFYAIATIRLGDAVLIQYLSPLIVAIMSARLLAERGSRTLWSALALGLLAVALVAQPQGSASPRGIAAALASAFLSAGAYVSVRALSRTDSPETIVLWFSAMATVVAGVATIPVFVAPRGRVLAALIATGVCAAIAQLLMTRAYAVAEASRVSIYGYATPVIAYLLGQLVLREPPGWRGVTGTALVVAAGLLARSANVRQAAILAPDVAR